MTLKLRHQGFAVLLMTVSLRAAVLQAASVSGLVSAEGEPVSDARVTLFTPPLEQFFEIRTQADGRYVLKDIPTGDYQLGVAAPGFEYEEIEIIVSSAPVVHNFALEQESHPGAWEVVGTTEPEIFDATDIGILLGDGTVFYCHNTVDPVRFYPLTGVTTPAGGSSVEQGCMNGTLLADGGIIMMGGQSPADPGSFQNAVPWVKTYSPGGDSWQFLPDMQHKAGRWYPGMARLADGSMLVMGGGQAPDAQRTETCERFDLDTQTWFYTGSMFNPTEFPPCALLYTGEVLATWSPPQLFDPKTEKWRLTGNFIQPNRGWPGHSDHSLVVLADGRALAVGVREGPDHNIVMGEVYDPITEQWALTSNPDLVRFQSEVVQLPDGRILVAGGESEQDPPPVKDVLGIVRWSDLYDPAADSWRRVADMIYFREYHAVTLLIPDGRVLTTGGTRIKFQYGPITSDIEAYSPPYLFRGVRPEIVSISTTEPRRGVTLVLGVAPVTQITSVVLMGAQTTTHWVDGGIPRRLVLPVEQRGNVVSVTLPTDANVVPLGRYMLFAMVDEVPSVARIINVRAANSADLNGDGVVGPFDLALLLGAWGPCPEPCTPGDPAQTCPADLNGDCEVEAFDLAVLLGAWG